MERGKKELSPPSFIIKTKMHASRRKGGEELLSFFPFTLGTFSFLIFSQSQKWKREELKIKKEKKAKQQQQRFGVEGRQQQKLRCQHCIWKNKEGRKKRGTTRRFSPFFCFTIRRRPPLRTTAFLPPLRLSSPVFPSLELDEQKKTEFKTEAKGQMAMSQKSGAFLSESDRIRLPPRFGRVLFDGPTGRATDERGGTWHACSQYAA